MLNRRIRARMWDTHIRPLRKLTNHRKVNRLPKLAVLHLLAELMAPGKELIGELDYEDVEEADPGLPDLEIIQAVAHIPQADAWADVEMRESRSPLGFEPEVSRSGYDVNLVHTNPTETRVCIPGYGRGGQDVGWSEFQDPWSWSAGYR